MYLETTWKKENTKVRIKMKRSPDERHKLPVVKLIFVIGCCLLVLELCG